MAELILTDHEKKTATFLEWNDEALGRAVKAVASILNDKHGKAAAKATGAAVFLISEGLAAGADEITVRVEGATDGKQDFGDWTVRLTKQEPAGTVDFVAMVDAVLEGKTAVCVECEIRHLEGGKVINGKFGLEWKGIHHNPIAVMVDEMTRNARFVIEKEDGE